MIFHALADDLIGKAERAENLGAVGACRNDLLRKRRDGALLAVIAKAHGSVAFLGSGLRCRLSRRFRLIALACAQRKCHDKAQ